MKGETVTISREEYEKMKSESEVDHELLAKLVRGLEDVRAGRVAPWKRSTA